LNADIPVRRPRQKRSFLCERFELSTKLSCIAVRDGRAPIGNGTLHLFWASAELDCCRLQPKPQKHTYGSPGITSEHRYRWTLVGRLKKGLALLSFIIMVIAGAFGADRLEPGLAADYFQMESGLDDFPKITADRKPTLQRVDNNINFASTLEAWPGTKLV